MLSLSRQFKPHRCIPRPALLRGGFTLIEIMVVVVIMGILAALPAELQLEILYRVVGESRWVNLLTSGMDISYIQTCVPRQLLQTSHYTAALTEGVLSKLYMRSKLHMDIFLRRLSGRGLGRADAAKCTPTQGGQVWSDMATWCGAALMMALQGAWYAKPSVPNGRAGLRFDEKALSALVNGAIKHLHADGQAHYGWSREEPARITGYRLRVFLADAIPQLLNNRAVEATIILGGPHGEVGSEFLEGTVRDLRYLAERLGVDVTLHVRCEDSDRQEWEAWFGQAKGGVGVEYDALDTWRAARPRLGAMSLWIWKYESETGQRLFMGQPDLMD